MGGFVRSSSWEEVNQLIAAANVYTIKTHGPDRVIGFSPIPAMSMVSYAAGSRYLSLIGGVCMSFYDWYCDLPPASPQIWGEQTDVPESADWYNSTYIIAWGSNVPQTRTPDAHFFTEVRYKGAKTVAITPDYSEVAKLADLWMHPKQGTDAALAMAMGHVVLKEFYFGGSAGRSRATAPSAAEVATGPGVHDRGPRTSTTTRAATPTCRCCCGSRRQTLADGSKVVAPGRYVRASDFADRLGQDNNPEWKTVAFDAAGEAVVPERLDRFPLGRRRPRRRGQVEPRGQGGTQRRRREAQALGARRWRQKHEVVEVAFPYFAGATTPHFPNNTQQGELNRAKVPAVRLRLADGAEALVATVFDLQVAQYGIDRGLGSGAKDYDDNAPYTPAWQEKITGVPRDQVITVAREFADNADGRAASSMIIIGAAMNHWYHADMNYRGVINLLMLCGCVGQIGRRLGALRRPGEAAPADRLDRARVRARLDPAAAPAELDLVLLRAYRPVALRETRRRGNPVAAGGHEGLRRQPDRLQRARRAHGLAAVRAAAEDQPAEGGQGRAGRAARPEGLRGRAR